MALQIKLTDDYGVEHAAAYARVRPSQLDIQQKYAQAEVFVYHDASAAIQKRKHLVPVSSYAAEGAIFDKYFSEVDSKKLGVSLYTQWYAYLKTLPAFVGFIDA